MLGRVQRNLFNLLLQPQLAAPSFEVGGFSSSLVSSMPERLDQKD